MGDGGGVGGGRASEKRKLSARWIQRVMMNVRRVSAIFRRLLASL